MKNVYRISPLETMADAIDFLQRLGAGEPFEDDRNQDDVRAKKKKEKKGKHMVARETSCAAAYRRISGTISRKFNTRRDFVFRKALSNKMSLILITFI